MRDNSLPVWEKEDSVVLSPAGHDQLIAPAVVLAPAQGLVIPGRGGGPTRVRHAEPGHRRWRSSGSYLECWRRAAISSSLLMVERPSSWSSAARSRSSSRVRSS